MENPITHPHIPYIGPIYGTTFGPGQMVRILGTTTSFAYRFSIDLQCPNNDIASQDDIALRVSVILDGFIALNSFQNGIWGEELRGRTLPLKRAEAFEVIILCDFNQYKIAINGQHYCEFPQRIHYDRITHLAIDGSVSINQISYESSTGSSQDEFPTTASVSIPYIPNKIDNLGVIDSNKAGHSKPQPVLLNNQRAPPLVRYHSEGITGPAGKSLYPSLSSPEITLTSLNAPNATSSNSNHALRPNTTKKEGATYYLIILMMAIVLFFVVCLL